MREPTKNEKKYREFIRRLVSSNDYVRYERIIV